MTADTMASHCFLSKQFVKNMALLQNHFTKRSN
jgi:hypothetical protein